jgi:hypothetical protein
MKKFSLIIALIAVSSVANAQYPMQNYNMDIGNPNDSGYRGLQQGNPYSQIDMNALEQQAQFEQQLRLQKQQLQIQQQLLQQYQINSQRYYNQ